MNSFAPQRLEGESFEEYKARRKEVNRLTKLKNKANWLPTRFVQRKLTEEEKK